MSDIQERIRTTRPDAAALPHLDVDQLAAAARRRTRVSRAAASIGVAGAVVAVATLVGVLQPDGGVAIDPLGPGTGGPTATASGPEPTSTTATAPPEDAWSAGEVTARPAPGDLAAAGAGGPAAPVCTSDAAPPATASVVIGTDVPDPRCLQVLPGQRVRIALTEEASEPVTGQLGGFRFALDPGEAVVLNLPVSNYLEPGVHRITSPYGPAQAEVWVLQAPSASLGQQAVLDAVVAFARDPSDATFAALPLADEVTFGTVAFGTSPQPRAAADLREFSAWDVEEHGHSALSLLRQGGDELVSTVGPRPHCGGPAPAAPPGLEDLTRLSIQPPPNAACDGWFAVDLYVDGDGTGSIRAVVIGLAGG